MFSQPNPLMGMNKFVWHDREAQSTHLVTFAKTLFPETEEETLNRIIEEAKPTFERKEFLRVAQLFHQERKRIENETT